MNIAYKSRSNVFHQGTTLYISGTHSLEDVVTDLTVPVGLRQTPRYKQALREVRPWTKTVVGHSLGGAIAQALVEDNSQLRGRTYGSPAMSWTPNPRIEAFRRYGDPVSMTNRAASSSLPESWNPHSYGGY